MTTYAITFEGRQCTACKKFQPWDNYHRHPSGANKRESKCKDCRSTLRKEERRAANNGLPDFRRTFTWVRPGVQRGHVQPGAAIEWMLKDGCMEAGWILEQYGQRYTVRVNGGWQRLVKCT